MALLAARVEPPTLDRAHECSSPTESDIPANATRRDRSRWGMLLACALWFASTFFFLGDIGKWADDRTWHLHDPAHQTDRVTPHVKNFWRPIAQILVIGLQTALWQHDDVNHLITAGVHALAAWLLYRLLRQLRIRRHIAFAVSLAFLVYPVQHQTAMWNNAMTIGLATCLVLLCYIVVVRFAQRRTGWWIVPPLWLGAFAIPCLYEQHAAALLVLPALHVAASRRDGPTRERLERAAVPATIAWMAVLTQVLIRAASLPPGFHGQPDTLIAPADLPAKIAQFATETTHWLLLRGLKEAAMHLGIEALLEHPARTALLIGTVLIAGTRWARNTNEAPRQPLTRPIALACTGTALALVAWLPILIVNTYERPDSRMFHLPLAGIAIVIAVVAHQVQVRHVWVERCIRLGVVALTLAGAIMMVGLQSAYRMRADADDRQTSTILRSIPNPPPNTIFVPLRIDDANRTTSKRVNAIFFYSAWSHPWTTRHHLRAAYGRDDIFAGFGRRARGKLGVAHMTHQHLVYTRPLPAGEHAYPPNDNGGYAIPWRLVVPFVIDDQHRVLFVTEVKLENGHVIRPPLTQHLPEDIERCSFRQATRSWDPASP